MRTFTANFTSLMTSRSSDPYHILAIEWTAGSPTYYLDRASTDFTAAGTRCPATIQSSRVVEWGNIALDLKENAIGGVDSTTVKLFDNAGAIKTLLTSGQRQRKSVRIYRMFDHASCVWGTDEALVFSGSLKPTSWTESDNLITLTIEDSSKRLVKDVSHIATSSIFEHIQPDYRDRNLPIVFGRAERVPAILVDQPWETKTLEAIPSGASSVTVDIQDHPDDLGIPTGTPIEVYVDGDRMTATFTQSGDPANTPSTMTLSASENTRARAVISYAFETGTARYGVILPQSVWPPSQAYNLESWLIGYEDCNLYLQPFAGMTNPSGWHTATMSILELGNPWTNSYKVQFDSAYNPDLSPGCQVQWIDQAAGRRAYEPGVIVRPIDGEWVYVANSLPSKAVIKVEGYGEVKDDSGAGKRDWIMLGKLLNDTLDGSVVTEDTETDPFTVNLNDDTWDYTGSGAPEEGTDADLGHCCTTITFTEPPRSINPMLESNRIWVTLRGCEDNRDSTGTLLENPALIMLEYLEHPDLLAVDAANIDTAAFTTAATSLSSVKCGFAQLESQNGLAYLQDISRQCHSVLLFDQGKVSIVVLSNTAGTNRLTLDNNSGGTDNILERSLQLSESDVDEVVSQITAKWRRAWDDIDGNKLTEVVRKSDSAIAEFGLRNIDLDLWIYWRRSEVDNELSFQMTRQARIYRHVSLGTFLDGVALQPGDWARVSHTDGESTAILSSKAIEILRVNDTGLEGVVELSGRYALFSY